MTLVGEVGVAQMIKHGEVTCGDAVEVVRNEDNIVVVLSDGLGSGVKANILSNLTIKIASKMISSNVPLEDVVETIVQTLPTCQVRGLAYSTFSILRLYNDGVVHLMDFDGCPVLRIKQGFVEEVRTSSQEIAGRIINESWFRMSEGESLLVVSDGVTQAGLGLTLPLGLGTKGLMEAIKSYVKTNKNAQDIANQVIEICQSYYLSEPGDDTTAVVVQLKQAKRAVVWTGPAKNMADDRTMVEKFLAEGDVKILCGGTTAKIFARETGREIRGKLCYIDPKIPPISEIDGVDLVTEGIITLSEGLKLIERFPMRCQGEDGAHLLLNQLLECDQILFLVGTQVNEAYLNMALPGSINLRKVVMEKWIERLRAMGKLVEVEWY